MENLRLDYPLTEESIVFDLGGYRGDFAHKISEKYNCYIYLYEPQGRMFTECKERLKNKKKINCFNYGLFNVSDTFSITNEEDASSIVKNSGAEQVSVKSFAEEVNALNIPFIDLLKINIEGAEFLLLTHILKENLIQKINFIQVQFHSSYPNAGDLRDEIRSKLSETHTEMWNFPFKWESWRKKP